MARLIDADAIKYTTLSYGGWGGPPEEIAHKYNIDKMPTVDAVPVVHGRWESFYLFDDFNGNRVYEHHHLECGFRQRNWAEHLDYNYCPNCGATMDLEVNNV